MSIAAAETQMQVQVKLNC